MSHFRRRLHGEGVLLVNVDGHVYRVLDAYVPELALGNLAEQSLVEFLSSPSYEASLVRDVEEYERHCKGCEYHRGCTGSFIYETRPASPYEGNCVTAWHCIRFMVKFLQENGYGDGEVRQLLTLVRKDGHGANPTVSV